MRHVLRNSLMRTRLISTAQETANCMCNTPYKCGTSYFGETRRPWTERLGEDMQNLEVGHLERYRCTTSCEENRCLLWKEAKILGVEKEPVYRIRRKLPT